MSRFEITREEDRLTLTLPLDDRLLPTGCGLLFVAFLCVAATGLLTLVADVDASGYGRRTEPFDSFAPSRNHFAFLWAVGTLVMLVLVPWYISRAWGARTVFAFAKDRGLFLRNDKPVTPLRRIEYALIRTLHEPNGTFSYQLFVIYGDGYEMLIDDSSDEQGTLRLAEEIARFLDSRVVWK